MSTDVHCFNIWIINTSRKVPSIYSGSWKYSNIYHSRTFRVATLCVCEYVCYIRHFEISLIPQREPTIAIILAKFRISLKVYVYRSYMFIENVYLTKEINVQDGYLSNDSDYWTLRNIFLNIYSTCSIVMFIKITCMYSNIFANKRTHEYLENQKYFLWFDLRILSFSSCTYLGENIKHLSVSQ